MELKKRIYIVLFLVMVIVLAFYALNRLKVKTYFPITSTQYCGDQICQSNENQISCCRDCGCPSGQVCINNECQVGTITTTTFGTTQTTEYSSGESGGSPPTGETTPPSGESGESSGTQTTTTTLYMGCSIRNCEACKNATACYDVGCIWCKVSSQCRIICKG